MNEVSLGDYNLIGWNRAPPPIDPRAAASVPVTNYNNIHDVFGAVSILLRSWLADLNVYLLRAFCLFSGRYE